MLRLLCHWMLALCLVLTGIGSATASASMHMAMPSPAAAQPADDCDHAAPTGADPASSIAPAPPHDGCGDNCCNDPAGCRCACMQLAQFLDFCIASLAQVLPRIEAGTMPPRAHPAPPAGEDIRPPIGQA